MKTIRSSMVALLASAAALAFLVPLDDYAGSVASFMPGPGGDDFGYEALGPPSGGGLFSGSTDAASLGVSGSLTLEMSVPAGDGPGTDLIVCENPFLLLGDPSTSFAEVCTVEVSSDNQHFARFPVKYSGPVGPFLPTQGAKLSWYTGLAGVRPVLTSVPIGPAPLDVVHAGGDAFDLADLADDPQVLAGQVILGDISYVRLTDIDTGTALDDFGTAIWDCGLDTISSADIDAVIGVNNHANLVPGRPQVELSLDAAGFLTLHVVDPDGLKDVKQGLDAAIDTTPVPFFALLPFFALTQVDAFSFTLVTGPVPPGVYPVELRVGTVDKSGLYGGDALRLP
ncbi:MAG TPA: hypothetical protein VFY71_01190 [Planctomycetota bacterium]|nr:hypothetical protein [Planctomycetota bacterium]